MPFNKRFSYNLFKIKGPRGNNLHDVETPTGQNFIVYTNKASFDHKIFQIKKIFNHF